MKGDDIIGPLVSLMKFSGFWLTNQELNETRKTVKKSALVRTGLMVFIWLFPTVRLAATGFKDLLTKSTVFIPIGICVLGYTFIFFAQFDRIVSNIRLFKEILSLHQDEWAVQVVETELHFINRLFDIQKITVAVYAFFYICFPFVVDIIFNRVVPYQVPLPLSGFLKDDEERNLIYWWATLGSQFWLVLVSSNYIGYFGVVCYLTGYSVIELRILSMRIKTLKTLPSTEWQLPKIIAAHRVIIRVVNKEMSWIGFPISFHNTVSTMTLCLQMYLGNQAIRNEDYAFLAFVVFFLFLLTTVIFVSCHVGQLLEEESLNVLAALYDLPWHEQSASVQKDLNMMMRQAARPLSLQYKRQVVNHRSLAKVLDMAYSFFMLIKSVE